MLGENFFQVEGRAQNAPILLVAGKPYRLRAKNVGSALHELVMGRGLTGQDAQGPQGYEEDLLHGVEVAVQGKALAGGEGRAFEVEALGLAELELDPGVELTVEFTLPRDRAGVWEMGCFAPGHYQAGMHVPLEVVQ